MYNLYKMLKCYLTGPNPVQSVHALPAAVQLLNVPLWPLEDVDASPGFLKLIE